ncbi:Uncharacterized protein APZ42_019207 [Daphnia magna]|uniref:Uncharacterized protein n=1 Tax=Daphnia magna TaxID=35525 RepID=A0A164YE70_9CRUS|nr:Uncharacterized protein APZ42_019207 [Daphnia magna]
MMTLMPYLESGSTIPSSTANRLDLDDDQLVESHRQVKRPRTDNDTDALSAARLGESGHVSSPASQSESTCGSPGEQGGGSGGGGHNGHPPEGQPAIQQQQGGLVGTVPSSGSLVSRTMTSSTPTYSSSPASWTLPTPSDNSLGNRDDVKCNCIQNIIFFFFPLNSTYQNWLKTVLLFPTCITIFSFG